MKKQIKKKLIVNIEQGLEQGKEYNIMSKMSYWKKFKDRFFPERTYLINMELRNGMHRTFMISVKDETFKFMNGTYLIDPELKYFNISTKCWCFDYHQDFDMPIKRIIPIKEVQKGIEFSKLTEVENATNPSTLEHFIVSKIAEGVMRGQMIDEFLKQIRLLIIIGTTAAVLMLILFVIKSGMLQSVNLPFM